MKRFNILLFIVLVIFSVNTSKAQMKLEEMNYEEAMDWVKWKVQTKGSVWFNKEWYLKSAALKYSGNQITYSFEKFTVEEDGDFKVENTYNYTYKFNLKDISDVSIYSKEEKVIGITLTGDKSVTLTGTHKLRDKYRATSNSKYKKTDNLVIYVEAEDAEKFMSYLNHARDQINGVESN